MVNLCHANANANAKTIESGFTNITRYWDAVVHDAESYDSQRIGNL